VRCPAVFCTPQLHCDHVCSKSVTLSRLWTNACGHPVSCFLQVARIHGIAVLSKHTKAELLQRLAGAQVAKVHCHSIPEDPAARVGSCVPSRVQACDLLALQWAEPGQALEHAVATAAPLLSFVTAPCGVSEAHWPSDPSTALAAIQLRASGAVTAPAYVATTHMAAASHSQQAATSQLPAHLHSQRDDAGLNSVASLHLPGAQQLSPLGTQRVGHHRVDHQNLLAQPGAQPPYAACGPPRPPPLLQTVQALLEPAPAPPEKPRPVWQGGPEPLCPPPSQGGNQSHPEHHTLSFTTANPTFQPLFQATTETVRDKDSSGDPSDLVPAHRCCCCCRREYQFMCYSCGCVMYGCAFSSLPRRGQAVHSHGHSCSIQSC
jgi:hypothetical protein